MFAPANSQLGKFAVGCFPRRSLSAAIDPEPRRREAMSIDLTAASHRKAKLEPDSDGDVVIASIWLVFNLLMIIGALFVQRDEPWVPLALFAAVLCGWVVLGWRKQKKADGIVKSRAPHV